MVIVLALQKHHPVFELRKCGSGLSQQFLQVPRLLEETGLEIYASGLPTGIIAPTDSKVRCFGRDSQRRPYGEVGYFFSGAYSDSIRFLLVPGPKGTQILDIPGRAKSTFWDRLGDAFIGISEEVFPRNVDSPYERPSMGFVYKHDQLELIGPADRIWFRKSVIYGEYLGDANGRAMSMVNESTRWIKFKIKDGRRVILGQRKYRDLKESWPDWP